MTSLAARAWGKLLREQRAARDLIDALIRDGYESASHLRSERAALRAGTWANVRHHLRSRLNLRAARGGTPTGRFFRATGVHDVEGLTFHTLARGGPSTVDVLPAMRTAELTDLYNYFRYFGDFRVANTLRVRLLEHYFHDLRDARRVTKDTIAAALELGHPGAVLSAAAVGHAARSDRTSVSDATALAHALSGDRAAAEVIWRTRYRETDAAFRELIAGRSVAVVGPAPPGRNVGSEIDTHDVVVRTNYRIGSNTPEEWYGARTDVAYYNHMRMTYNKDEVIAATAHMKWAVLKSLEDESRFRAWLPDFPGGVRHSFTANPVFFQDGAPMAIQNILNDLIRFAPVRLKLFCTTFHNSAETYNKTYRTQPLKPEVISGSLRIHEPFGGFAFVQHLVRAGLCATDDVTGSVLALSREQYAEGLNEKYGGFPCQ